MPAMSIKAAWSLGREKGRKAKAKVLIMLSPGYEGCLEFHEGCLEFEYIIDQVDKGRLGRRRYGDAC